MRRTFFVTSILLMVALISAACGGGAKYNQPPAAAPTDTTAPAAPGGGSQQAVKIANFAFDPATLTVTVGTTVKWTNSDSAEHTVTADDGSFDSGQLNQGQSFSFTFSKAGTFSYKCGNHPNMVAKVVVQ